LDYLLLSLVQAHGDEREAVRLPQVEEQIEQQGVGRHFAAVVVLVASVVVLAQETLVVEFGGRLAVVVRMDSRVWAGKQVEVCRQEL
jgi:hypothetical protein